MKLQTSIILFSFVMLSTSLLTLPLWVKSLSQTGAAQAQDAQPTTPPDPTTAPNPSTVPSAPADPTDPPTPSDPAVPSDPPIPSNPPTPSDPPVPSEVPSPRPSSSAEPTLTPVPSTSPVVSPTPVVSTSPNPSDSPRPGEGHKRSKLSLSGPNCTDFNIEATVVVYENDQPKQGVAVEFIYKTTGEIKALRQTDNQGKAGASFGYTQDGTVYANISGDFGSQSAAITAPQNCDLAIGGSTVMGNAFATAKAGTGTVLGTDTSALAPTSSLPVGTQLSTILGTVVSLLGLGLRIKRG